MRLKPQGALDPHRQAQQARVVCSARIRPWISNSICSAGRRRPQVAPRPPTGSRGRAPPCQARTIDQRIAHRAGPVVELDRAADVDAARIDFDRHALHPVVEQRAQARQAARLRTAWREETPLFEAVVVLADHRDPQFSREPKWANTPDLLIRHRPGRRWTGPPAHVGRRSAPHPGWRPGSAGAVAALNAATGGSRRRWRAMPG